MVNAKNPNTSDGNKERSMRSGKAPAHHEWQHWADGLWRCPWCDGFYASNVQPPKNAVAMNNATAKKYGIEIMPN